MRYLDVGTSGGLLGLERGYCLMIGGEDQAVQQLEPIFSALAPGAVASGKHRQHRDARLSARAVRPAPAISSRWSTTASSTA